MSSMAAHTRTLKDGRVVTIRHGVPADAARCLDYIRLVLPESPHLLIDPTEIRMSLDEEVQWLQSHLDDPGSLAMIAEHGEELIGLLNFRCGARIRNRHSGAFGITVRAAWRGLGIGAAMLKALIDWARANPGLDSVTLGVFASNTGAIALYERLGFRECGRAPRCYKVDDEYIDGVQMYLRVKGE